MYDDAIFDSVMHYSFGQKIVLHLEDFNATMYVSAKYHHNFDHALMWLVECILLNYLFFLDLIFKSGEPT